MAGPTKQRVFIHYVLGKIALLFFLCHPGTLATCDGQAYLRNRYANRDVVTSESELNDLRRHYRRRDASEFTMKIGVPDEILHGDVDSYTPDWAPSLEERFQNTVKAWLRKGGALAAKDQAEENAGPVVATAATTAGEAVHAPTMMAFVPSLTPRAGVMVALPQRSANDRLMKRRRVSSLDVLGTSPQGAAWNARPPARTRRVCGHFGCGCGGGGGGRGDTSMLLGRLRRGGFPLRRASGEGDSKIDGSNGASTDGADLDVEPRAETSSVARATRVVEIKKAARLEDPEPTPPASIISSLLGGAADAYDNAVSFVGSTLIRSEIGKKYMNGYDSGPTFIRRTGGGPTDMNTGSTYDLVGFSNIDPFEASGRRGGSSRRL